MKSTQLKNKKLLPLTFSNKSIISSENDNRSRNFDIESISNKFSSGKNLYDLSKNSYFPYSDHQSQGTIKTFQTQNENLIKNNHVSNLGRTHN